ncbi:alpha-amylase family glycosyl hydrolase [Ascidiimonas sp. W6]|uniref:alpha-amylase family glycosyl hydrolase n=1 Tax=Ascidiimonas meishanensis TaxID=3128903 RepID=UPI0030EF4DE6
MDKSILENLLSKIYTNDIDFLMEKIQILLSKYENIIQVKEQKLTHKDCILITYADAIYEEDHKPLNTLKTFYDTYLKDKISAIHLLPCFPYTSDDGFSVVDYYQINPDYGDWKSIASLNESADLMFDAVINHMSKSSVWFHKFMEEESPFDTYFITSDPAEDHSKVVRPRALPLLHKYNKNGKEFFLWTTFSEDQVDLNFRSPYVFLQVLDILLFYISKGSRFIRLDAIAFLWKEKGTSCIHLPETHQIIQAYRKIIESLAPEVILITETNVPHLENISYFGDGSNEAHMVYNFTLPPLLAYSVHQQDISTFVNWAKTLDLANDTNCFFNFTASHDGIGIRPLQGIISDNEIALLAEKTIEHGGYVSYKDNGDGSSSPYELNCNYFELLSHPNEPINIRIDKFILTQAIMLSMPGVPGIYYHSILGSLNFRKGVEESGINRRINREKLAFPDLVSEITNAQSLRHQVYERYIKLLELRAKEPSFNPYGKARFSEIGKALVIERSYDQDCLICIFNLSEHHLNVKLPVQKGYELVHNKRYQNTSIDLNPWGFKWIKIDS